MHNFYSIIQGMYNPFWDGFFIIFSFLGSEPSYILILAIIFWNIDKRFGFRIGVLFLTSMTLNGFLKDFFQTIRPIGQEGIRSIYTSSATGNSFPSGHSQGAATFYSYLAIKWKKRLILALSVIMTIAIGFSRLYLGLHWPGDVIGGYILGLITVIVFILLERKIFILSFSLRVKILLSLLLPLLFSLVYHSYEGLQLIGYLMGYTTGYFLEDYYIDYCEKTTIKKSISKTFFGLIVLGIWVLIWEKTMKANLFVIIPVFLSAGLWTSFIAPIFFRAFGWEGSKRHKNKD